MSLCCLMSNYNLWAKGTVFYFELLFLAAQSSPFKIQEYNEINITSMQIPLSGIFKHLLPTRSKPSSQLLLTIVRNTIRGGQIVHS